MTRIIVVLYLISWDATGSSSTQKSRQVNHLPSIVLVQSFYPSSLKSYVVSTPQPQPACITFPLQVLHYHPIAVISTS